MFVAVFHRDDFHLRRIREVILPFLDDRFCDRGRVDRRVAELGEKMGESADVVVVPVGKDDTLDIGLFSFKILDVRDDVVYARRFLFGKLETYVYEDDLGMKKIFLSRDMLTGAANCSLALLDIRKFRMAIGEEIHELPLQEVAQTQHAQTGVQRGE